MADFRIILAVAVLAGGLTYGGFLGVELLVTDDRDAPPAPLSGEVTVEGTSYHLDRIGRPTVVGEVENGKSHPIENVTVAVTFRGNGTDVGTTVERTLAEPIPPGETAPFEARFSGSESVDGYNTSVSADRGDSPGDALVADAEVTDRSQNRVILSGTVENTGDRPLGATVVATFYDDSGRVIGVRTARSTNAVASGEAYPFTVTFNTVGDVPSLAQRFDRFEIDVVPREPNAETTTETATETARESVTATRRSRAPA